MTRVSRLLLLSLCLGAAPAAAQTPSAPPSSPAKGSALAQDLKRLTIEELAELDVTSVSRGVATLAEAMRLGDGLDVARSDGRTWNITARGFNIVTANKLLVLMDGRTLYSPLFSGTFWEVQDTVMTDVDRIEVIRGPGGTIW